MTLPYSSDRCRPSLLTLTNRLHIAWWMDFFYLLPSCFDLDGIKTKTLPIMGDVDPYVAQKYEVTKRLGKGAYGIVWKAVEKRNKKIVALKKIYDAFRNRTDAQRTFREIWYLQEFQHHPNIIRLLEVVKSKNDRDIYLVFDFMETDLHRAIKNGLLKDSQQYKFIIHQLLSALAYIHSVNVIHRDLKPSNILLNCKFELKLADFGLARSLEQTGELAKDPTLTEYVATRWYRAPEILLGSKRYTKGVDVWSVGCILGEIITGRALFPGTSTLNQIERIMVALPQPSQSDIESLCSGYAAYVLERAANKPKRLLRDVMLNTPDDAIDLMAKLLVLNPLSRITAKESLCHPYLSEFQRNELPIDRTKTLPPLCDHTKLPVNQYREKLYQMINESISVKSLSPTGGTTLSPSYLEKMNEKRIIVKQRSYDEMPKIDERKEELLRNALVRKKSVVAPIGQKTSAPPVDKGKFSLKLKHHLSMLQGQKLRETKQTELKDVAAEKQIPKFGRRQYGNVSNHASCTSAKAALQNYNQTSSYGVIPASTFQAIKEGHW